MGFARALGRAGRSGAGGGSRHWPLLLQMEAELVEQPQVLVPEPELPNGMEKAQAREPEKRSKLSAEELSRIEEEDVLDKMVHWAWLSLPSASASELPQPGGGLGLRGQWGRVGVRPRWG